MRAGAAGLAGGAPSLVSAACTVHLMVRQLTQCYVLAQLLQYNTNCWAGIACVGF